MFYNLVRLPTNTHVQEQSKWERQTKNSEEPVKASEGDIIDKIIVDEVALCRYGNWIIMSRVFKLKLVT